MYVKQNAITIIVVCYIYLRTYPIIYLYTLILLHLSVLRNLQSSPSLSIV